MNHEADCRTAPATPGLLIISLEDLSFQIKNTNSEGNCSNCKETHQLPNDLSNSRSKYYDLLVTCDT